MELLSKPFVEKYPASAVHNSLERGDKEYVCYV